MEPLCPEDFTDSGIGFGRYMHLPVNSDVPVPPPAMFGLPVPWRFMPGPLLQSPTANGNLGASAATADAATLEALSKEVEYLRQRNTDLEARVTMLEQQQAREYSRDTLLQHSTRFSGTGGHGRHLAQLWETRSQSDITEPSEAQRSASGGRPCSGEDQAAMGSESSCKLESRVTHLENLLQIMLQRESDRPAVGAAELTQVSRRTNIPPGL